MRELKFKDLETLVGQEIGVSDWFQIRQDEVQAFADLTRDHEWIHVDVERANREFGGPIAHGYHILSLLPFMTEQILTITDIRNGLNYGLNNLRFTNMVRVGKRVRLRQKVLAIEPKGEGKMLRSLYTIEIEGETKPAMIAEALFLIFTA